MKWVRGAAGRCHPFCQWHFRAVGLYPHSDKILRVDWYKFCYLCAQTRCCIFNDWAVQLTGIQDGYFHCECVCCTSQLQACNMWLCRVRVCPLCSLSHFLIPSPFTLCLFTLHLAGSQSSWQRDHCLTERPPTLKYIKHFISLTEPTARNFRVQSYLAIGLCVKVSANFHLYNNYKNWWITLDLNPLK